LSIIEENLNKYVDILYTKLPENKLDRKLVAENVFEAMKKVTINENIRKRE